MAGEFNATTVIFQKGAVPVDIVGLGEFNVTVGGEPITYENKSAGDWVLRLDGELSGQEVIVSGTFSYNDDALYQSVLTDAQTGAHDDYTMVLPDGRSFTGKFIPHGVSYAMPRGGAATTPVTFSSHEEITFTDPT